MAGQKKKASKSARGGASASRSTKGRDAQRARLEKDLKTYITKIDDDGLIFLLKQAHVILHNLEVDKINKEIEEHEEKKAKGKPGKSEKAILHPGVEIKPSTDEKSFIIVMNNSRKIFSLSEMQKIVSICQSARSDEDAAARLYAWFSQNRQDVLGDVGIGNSRHPVLPLLYRVVKSTYKTAR